MAPRTRPKKMPSRRVRYARIAKKRAGTLRNPIVVDVTSSRSRNRRSNAPTPLPRIKPTDANTVPTDSQRAHPAVQLMLDTPASVLPRLRGRQVLATPEIHPTIGGSHIKSNMPESTIPDANNTPEMRECTICAATKTVERSFTRPIKGICSHFTLICKRCVMRMVEMQTEERRLDVAVVACPEPDCMSVLDYLTLQAIVPAPAFERALTTQLLRSDDNFLTCLNTECARYFSKEACKTKRVQKHEVHCPYCDHAMCLTCTRPWHPDNSCNKEKNDENVKSEAAIRSMGAKPCPKCGVNFEKNGGCDHMICNRCHHNFCFECLVEYKASMVHHRGCRNGHQNIADDPRNWLPDHDINLNLDQLVEGNALRIARRLGAV